MPANKLTREQISELLRRHKGSIAQVADSLEIRSTGVSLWLDGKSTSARIAVAAEAKAHELLKLEQKQAAGSPPKRAPKEPARPAA